ncbi:MlaD family protein [Nocardia altamirensis]|uniref:MlaD family protein n=1 Tax=Nocardia altamirensis TaxID=472158 RepID=UPI00083FE291|nr:MlaD family protein [Nocardia altamirensis]
MLRKFLASRGFVSILGGVLAAVVAAAAAFVLLEPTKKAIGYCAIMPDAIGLYTGNDVTMRGMKIGTVTGIRPEGLGVRVDFEVDAAHPLRGAASAATVSDTIVADRDLAVLGTKGGADWNSGVCVTKTATPKSLTRTFNALSKVADELQGGDDPAQRDRIKQAVTQFDKATAGNGPKFNDIIQQLAAALRQPDAAISNIGSLIDRLNELSASVANGWGNLRQMLDGFAPILQTVNDVWGQVVEIVNSIVTILPWFNDITTKYGGPLLRLLDDSVPYLHLLSANVGSVQQLIDMVPAIAELFRTVTDPATQRLAVSYAPPKVTLAQADANQVCAAINAIAPGRCPDPAGMAKVDLVSFVLTMGGV